MVSLRASTRSCASRHCFYKNGRPLLPSFYHALNSSQLGEAKPLTRLKNHKKATPHQSYFFKTIDFKKVAQTDQAKALTNKIRRNWSISPPIPRVNRAFCAQNVGPKICPVSKAPYFVPKIWCKIRHFCVLDIS